MGERANAIVLDEHHNEGNEGAVCLYTHWGGYKLPETVRVALNHGRERWNDESYLARIVFDMLVGDDQGSTTSYGISTFTAGDANYPFIILYKERVYVRDRADSETYAAIRGGDQSKSLSFEEFCNVDGIGDERNWGNFTEVAASV